MAEERITEKEEFTPQQYSHQSSKLFSIQIKINNKIQLLFVIILCKFFR